MSFTNQQLADCAALEVHWRRIVYPKRIAAGKLDATHAGGQIAMMQAIRDHFEALAAIDAPPLPDIDLGQLMEEAS